MSRSSENFLDWSTSGICSKSRNWSKAWRATKVTGPICGYVRVLAGCRSRGGMNHKSDFFLMRATGRRCEKRSRRPRFRKRRSSDWRFFTLCGIRRCPGIRLTESSTYSVSRMCRMQRCAPFHRRSCTYPQSASVWLIADCGVDDAVGADGARHASLCGRGSTTRRPVRERELFQQGKERPQGTQGA